MATKISVTFGESIAATPLKLKSEFDKPPLKINIPTPVSITNRKKFRFSVYSVKEILPYLKRKFKNGDYVNRETCTLFLDNCYYEVAFNLKLKTFLQKGIFCYRCGLKGEYFAIERDLNNGTYKVQLNLYNGNMLFNHDHIKARSLGGQDSINNTCTMCERCNNKKSHFENIYARLKLRKKSKLRYELYCTRK